VIPASCNYQLNFGIINALLRAFHPQNLVTVVKIEIDPALRKDLLQNENDIPGIRVILHISLKDRQSHGWALAQRYCQNDTSARLSGSILQFLFLLCVLKNGNIRRKIRAGTDCNHKKKASNKINIVPVQFLSV